MKMMGTGLGADALECLGNGMAMYNMIVLLILLRMGFDTLPGVGELWMGGQRVHIGMVSA